MWGGVISFLDGGLVGWILWGLGFFGVFGLFILNQKQADSGRGRYVQTNGLSPFFYLDDPFVVV